MADSQIDWYYGFLCKTCNEPLPVEASANAERLGAVAMAGWEITCDRCGHVEEYSGEMVRIYTEDLAPANRA